MSQVAKIIVSKYSSDLGVNLTSQWVAGIAIVGLAGAGIGIGIVFGALATLASIKIFSCAAVVDKLYCKYLLFNGLVYYEKDTRRFFMIHSQRNTRLTFYNHIRGFSTQAGRGTDNRRDLSL